MTQFLSRLEWVAIQPQKWSQYFIVITLLTGGAIVSVVIFFYIVIVLQFITLILSTQSSGDSLSLLEYVAVFTNQLSTPSSLQYLNMSNLSVHVLYIFILVIIVYFDGILITVRELIRSRARLPSEDVINHFNDRAYGHGIDLTETVQKSR